MQRGHAALPPLGVDQVLCHLAQGEAPGGVVEGAGVGEDVRLFSWLRCVRIIFGQKAVVKAPEPVLAVCSAGVSGYAR